MEYVLDIFIVYETLSLSLLLMHFKRDSKSAQILNGTANYFQ